MTIQREVNHDSEIFETFKQEEIEDEKGTKNVVADDLSKLTIDSTSDITPIDDYFPDESLLSLSLIPWSATCQFSCFRIFASSLEYPRQKKVFERSEELLLG